jgi:hypothetical protein
MAAAPSCGAVAPESTPWKAPMGVRRAATITTEIDIHYTSPGKEGPGEREEV